MGSLTGLHRDLFGKLESGHWRGRSEMVLRPQTVSSTATGFRSGDESQVR